MHRTTNGGPQLSSVVDFIQRLVSEIDFLDDAAAVTNLSCIWEIGRRKGRERKTLRSLTQTASNLDFRTSP